MLNDAYLKGWLVKRDDSFTDFTIFSRIDWCSSFDSRPKLSC